MLGSLNPQRGWSLDRKFTTIEVPGFDDDRLNYPVAIVLQWFARSWAGGELWSCLEMAEATAIMWSPTQPPVWSDIFRRRTELLKAWNCALRRVA